MSMRRLKFRVHWLATLMLLIFVAGLAAVFLYVALMRFERMAEESAQAVFEQMSRASLQYLDGLSGRARSVLAMQAGLEPDDYRDSQASLNPRLITLMRSSLNANPELYALYHALPNEDFLQLIAVRGDQQVLASLQAPAGTWFAQRLIRAQDGQRIESWRFFDQQHKELGQRQAAASFLPSQRPWYALASQTEGVVATAPYMFQSSAELGLTLAQRQPGGEAAGVTGLDLSLRRLQDELSLALAAQPGAMLLLDAERRIIVAAGLADRAAELPPLGVLEQTGSARLRELAAAWPGGRMQRVLSLGGESHVLVANELEIVPGQHYTLIAFAPLSAFDRQMRATRDQVLWVSALFLLLSIPLAYGLSRRASRLLAALAADAERVKRLDFSGEVVIDSAFYELAALGEAYRTMKTSIGERTAALAQARDRLQSLVDTGLAMSSERDRAALLRQILMEGKRLCHADAATLYLVTDHDTLRFAQRSRDDVLPSFEIPLHDPATGKPNDHYVSVHAALNKQTVLIDDVYAETRFDLSGTRRFDAETGYRSVSMLTVPLLTVSGEVVGVLQLINALDPQSGAVVPFDRELIGFVEAMAAQGAVSLDNQHLMEALQHLMEALIRLIAGAIDAKSAYTGGHCERVPELALMLAHAACEVQSGPLADFRFASEDEWREFRIGAWLHDCGKLTTPEYVVDKAAKLETIYNRIHEVRTRFEVLLRDAEIERLRARLEGADPAAVDAAYAARQAQLFEDFAFVARCNEGGEFMPDADVERLKRIAAQTWLRHFDDRIGLSQEETMRRASLPPEPLPALEPLLGDKPWQRIARIGFQSFDAKFGFKMEVPELLYNFGELYNLSVRRGTLTEEERFKINEHIIQTILMLDQLPLPPQLKRVPEYAGTHHETLAGTGYPRRLDAGQLSIPARIVAIADIFEALTASDRPYKKPKTLSESIRILSLLVKDGHIDPDLFELFLQSGVYRQYAERYLSPEQIDQVDLALYLRCASDASEATG